MNETPVKEKANLISRIQQDYKSSLESSADKIGLDPHSVLYKGQGINILTIDECCEFLQSDARRSLLKILKGIDLEVFTSDEVKAYIDSIRPEVEKYDLNKARNGFVLPEDPNAPRINGKIILENFYHAFNKELCNAYDKFHAEK